MLATQRTLPHEFPIDPTLLAGPSTVRYSPPILAPRPIKAAERRTYSVSPSRSPSPEPSSPPVPRTTTPSRPPSRTERRFPCTFPGCNKAYFKPSRLAEHELSHTGERPHACPHCSQTYLRASHLHAHLRTHLSEEDKPFTCERDGCGKKFWTATHLKRHVMLHDAAQTFKCETCDAAFPKSHLLRDHVILTHMPPGTKPYPCTHEGCGASFAMKQHLKTHEKTHDPNRYTCSDASHNGDYPAFPTWTALQTHLREAHPPRCPHPECNGRAFKSASKLKEHLKVHEDREADMNSRMAKRPAKEDSDLDDLPDRRKRRKTTGSVDGEESAKASPRLPRMMDGQAGKVFACGYPECGKKFKTKYALTTHTRATHLQLRPYTCTFPGCDKAYAHQANLTRHFATHSLPSAPASRIADEDEPVTGGAAQLTGEVMTIRRFGCPAHIAEDLARKGSAMDTQLMGDLAPGQEDEDVGNTMLAERGVEERSMRCSLRFWRVYDVRRHLAAEHGMQLEDKEVRKLLMKAAKQEAAADVGDSPMTLDVAERSNPWIEKGQM